MSDLEHRLAERKSGEERKQRNAARFMWHERLIKSRDLTLTSVRLAGLIMHSRDLTTKGYVALSLKDAAADLSVTKQTVVNARDLLVTQGWLDQEAFRGQRKAHYKPTFPDPARVNARIPLRVNGRTTPLFRYFRSETRGSRREEAYQGREEVVQLKLARTA